MISAHSAISGCALAAYHAKDISFEKRSSAPLPNFPKIEAPNNTSGGTKGKPPNGLLKPIGGAIGAHTVFKKDQKGKITKYETYQPQTNPRYPKSWESVKRYDGAQPPHSHYNKQTMKDVSTHHIHDQSCPGGVRHPQSWEIPK